MTNIKTYLQKRQRTFFAIAPLLLITTLPVAPAHSQELNAKCILKIDGKTVMDDRCQFKSDADSDYFSDLRLVLVCPNGVDATKVSCAGAEQRVKRPGVFGYLFRKEGVASLCWNMGRLRRAEPCFEGLRRSGACWTNPTAKSRYGNSKISNIKFCAWSED
jgi:hypothetical protein